MFTIITKSGLIHEYYSFNLIEPIIQLTAI